MLMNQGNPTKTRSPRFFLREKTFIFRLVSTKIFPSMAQYHKVVDYYSRSNDDISSISQAATHATA